MLNRLGESRRSRCKMRFTLFEDSGFRGELLYPIFIGDKNTDGMWVEPLLAQAFVQFLVAHEAVDQKILDRYYCLRSRSVDLYGC